MIIRQESPKDIPQVRKLNELAFGQPTEANLVDKLRKACPDALSLVAEDKGCVVGHILFTPTVIDSSGQLIQGMGLAPMAVLPENQKQGIGSQMVKKGLEILRERGCSFVVVVGHPEYYPRFGFELASKHNIRSQWDGIPDDAFMIIIFDHNAMKSVKGVVRYRDEFNEAM
jgi:putative acetyltransferase